MIGIKSSLVQPRLNKNSMQPGFKGTLYMDKAVINNEKKKGYNPKLDGMVKTLDNFVSSNLPLDDIVNIAFKKNRLFSLPKKVLELKHMTIPKVGQPRVTNYTLADHLDENKLFQLCEAFIERKQPKYLGSPSHLMKPELGTIEYSFPQSMPDNVKGFYSNLIQNNSKSSAVNNEVLGDGGPFDSDIEQESYSHAGPSTSTRLLEPTDKKKPDSIVMYWNEDRKSYTSEYICQRLSGLNSYDSMTFTFSDDGKLNLKGDIINDSLDSFSSKNLSNKDFKDSNNSMIQIIEHLKTLPKKSSLILSFKDYQKTQLSLTLKPENKPSQVYFGYADAKECPVEKRLATQLNSLYSEIKNHNNMRNFDPAGPSTSTQPSAPVYLTDKERKDGIVMGVEDDIPYGKIVEESDPIGKMPESPFVAHGDDLSPWDGKSPLQPRTSISSTVSRSDSVRNYKPRSHPSAPPFNLVPEVPSWVQEYLPTKDDNNEPSALPKSSESKYLSEYNTLPSAPPASKEILEAVEGQNSTSGAGPSDPTDQSEESLVDVDPPATLLSCFTQACGDPTALATSLYNNSNALARQGRETFSNWLKTAGERLIAKPDNKDKSE